MDIGKIKDLVREELREHDREYQMDFHLAVVNKYAEKLAKIYNADREVIELAVWLHDIDRISGMKESHHLTGSERAAQLLRGLKYPEDVVERVKHCILTHRCKDGDPKPQTMEAKIVASADAMAHFDIIPFLVWMAAKETDMSAKEASWWLAKKIERNWNKKLLLPEARNMVREKYEAFKILFKELV